MLLLVAVQISLSSVSDMSVDEKLPIWRQYHTSTLGMLREEPQRNPAYGTFPLHCRYSLDQVPVPFVINQKSSFTLASDKQVRLTQPAPGLDKRQCTIQRCFRAGGIRCREGNDRFSRKIVGSTNFTSLVLVYLGCAKYMRDFLVKRYLFQVQNFRGD